MHIEKILLRDVGPFDDEGAEIAIESLPYRRTSMKRPRHDVWATLRVGPRAPSVASMPATLATIEPLVPPGPIQPTRTVRLGARRRVPLGAGLFDFQRPHDRGQSPGGRPVHLASDSMEQSGAIGVAWGRQA